MVVATGNDVRANGAGRVVDTGGERALAEVKPSVGSLTIYERIADPIAAARVLGDAICKSGMFGVSGPGQGFIFAMECLVRRQPPLMLKETYHVIQGSLSMRAEKMLSNFVEGGGRHRLLSRTGDLASIELTLNGEKQVFSLSWEEAKGEPFVYSGKEKEVVPLILAGQFGKLRIKDKYATPRARSQMMWARVVSDGVRAMMPSAICGCYTPEEVGDFRDADIQVPTANGTVATDFSQGEVIDGEFEVTSDAESGASEIAGDSRGNGDEPTLAASAAGGAMQTAIDVPEYCTGEQSKQITDLIAQLGMTDEQIANALKKRGASANRSLKYDVAAAFIVTLTEAVARKNLTLPAQTEEQAVQETIAETVGESREQPGNETVNPGGPATQEQEAEAKRLLAELNQLKPGIVNRFKAHLKANGLDKIMDLSAGECAALLKELHKKQLEVFFDNSLTGWKPKADKSLETAIDAIWAAKTSAECSEIYNQHSVKLSRESAEVLHGVYASKVSELDQIPF